MVAPLAGLGLAVTIVGGILKFLAGGSSFAPGACERIEPYLQSRLIGQDLAVGLLSDAVCDALVRVNPALHDGGLSGLTAGVGSRGLLTGIGRGGASSTAAVATTVPSSSGWAAPGGRGDGGGEPREPATEVAGKLARLASLSGAGGGLGGGGARREGSAAAGRAADPGVSGRPLVLSLHGPPGVGKSLTHALLARALYLADPAGGGECPGPACPAYRVLFGMDYLASDREGQTARLRSAVLAHLQAYPEALLVIEEYDKLDCDMRGFFRQLLRGGADAGKLGNSGGSARAAGGAGRSGNDGKRSKGGGKGEGGKGGGSVGGGVASSRGSWGGEGLSSAVAGKAIVILESNLGYLEVNDLVEEAGGDRRAIDPEVASRRLKDRIFSLWTEQECEGRTETLKTLGAIETFLPFFPLGREEIEALALLRLADRAVQLSASGALELFWEAEVPLFLADRVEFDAGFALEGGKEVGMLISRYVSRAVRQRARGVTRRRAEAERAGAAGRPEASDAPSRGVRPRCTLRVVREGPREVLACTEELLEELRRGPIVDGYGRGGAAPDQSPVRDEL